MALRLAPAVESVYDLPQVSNVCEQVLREVIRLTDVSLAHVTMAPRAVSLLHEHKKMREGYFMLGTNGLLYYGDQAFTINQGLYFPIANGTPHKLRNTGEKELEHLVFVSPPFNPTDVFLVDDKQHEPSPIMFVPVCEPLKIASDGAEVIELDSNERATTKKGIALGKLPSYRAAAMHKHEKTDEVYYVIAGTGNIHLQGKKHAIEKGSVIVVPRGIEHGLENLAAEPLIALCLSSPPYTESDFIIT